MTPLSSGQKRMWFSQQLDPVSPVYNTYRTWRLRGALNIEALESAIRTIVRRHSVLRAVIQVVDGTPCQMTDDAFSFELPVVDLRGSSPEAPETDCKESIQKEAIKPFELTRGPLFRSRLWRLGDEDHVLLLSMHHIITDGWSFGVLYREIQAHYEALTDGSPSPLPDLPLQYGDYALEQQAFLQGSQLENLLGYWKEQLPDLTPVQLPTDRIRSSWSTFRGAREGFSLGQALTDKLKALSQQEGVSLFTTLLACSKILLFRYSSQTDIAVGTMKHGRTRPELEPLIGMFMNTLVLRSDLSGNPRFRELLQRVRQTCKGAFAHEELPFDRLVDELHPDRVLGRNPLFQVAVTYHDTSEQTLRLPGLAVTPFAYGEGADQLGNDTSKFDLTLTFLKSEDEIQGTMEYSTDVLDRSTVRRAIDHLRTLIEGVVADPDQPIDALPLLSEAERQQLLVDWNATEAPLPRAACIHDLVDAQAGRTPDAVALVSGEDSLTYGELNTRANHLARYLQEHHGVGPEVCVGVCTERSVDMVVGILGILKAGGAYVPLDPNYPVMRLAYILEDAGVGVLLTQERLVAELPESRARVVCVDTDPACLPTGPVMAPESQVTSSNLAYLIYTSGSTGQPKGVAIEHRSAVALVQWAKGWFGEEELRGVLASTSMCFDLSVFEMFVPLSAGGSVILAESALDLPDLPNAGDVTLINTVPSGIAALLRRSGLPDSVRTVNLAGEPLKPQLVKQIEEASQVERVYDLYGPSEDTTYSTGTLRTGDGPEIIGRPIANTQAYVLDGNLQPVPVGVPGDLYLGGEGLARGYYHRPDLTAEKFIPNPFSDQPGARLYETGDLARYLADGTIKFLGRQDHQVKVRGYRIELGEIETALGQLPEVKDVVVVVREASTEDKRIVAYVVPSDGPLSPHDLRQALKQRLPEYMVPAHFVTLDALPLTPNGKIDRQHLPEPDGSPSERAAELVPPRNPLEVTLAGIWGDLLRVGPIGVHDDFFELGGNSLMATRLVSRVQQEFQVDLPLRHFLSLPTIAQLAHGLEGLLWISDGSRRQDTTGSQDREVGGI